MYSEDELLQLAALQHFVFCRRQCALIHIEQLWEDNQLTVEGKIMHNDVHEEGFENRKDVRIERGILLRSFTLGLLGKADVVEYRRTQGDRKTVLFPVEYKRGKPKPDHSDIVQLCAQALCLEEMLGASISSGALFYGRTRHRLDVEFTLELRRETKDLAVQLHEFIQTGITPPAEYSSKCESCSLIERCLPKSAGCNRSVSRYLSEAIEEL